MTQAPVYRNAVSGWLPVEPRAALTWGAAHTGRGWGAQGHTCRVDLPVSCFPLLGEPTWNAWGTAESHRFAHVPRLPHCVLLAWMAQWDLSDASGVGAVGMSLVKFGAG